MNEWIQQTLPQLPTGLSYYLILCGITLAEGIPVAGLFMPGSVICIAAGALAFHGHGNIYFICIAAGMGAIAGDCISYMCGTRSGAWLATRLRGGKFFRFLCRAELFFGAHGGKSLLLARFVGPVRGFVPFVAGGARMQPGLFCVYTLIGGIAWGIAYPLAGYLGGKALKFSYILNQIPPAAFIVTGLIIALLLLAYFRLRRKNKQ
ncbi:MAG: DedA family protein [Desulfuromonadaceae bacterium]|nr:DedA family protein [Desulfuromonadaceae bacterium]